MSREELAGEVLKLALDSGASAAEVIVREGEEFSTSVRLGSVETLLQANFRKLGVRVFTGSRAAISATSDLSAASLRALVGETLSMARAGWDDVAGGLPPAEVYSDPAPRLPLFYPAPPSLTAEAKIAQATLCEGAALGFDPRINNSEGAGFSDSLTHLTYANSQGVTNSYSKTRFSLHAVPLAGNDGRMQRDYWLSSHLDYAQLQAAEEVGLEAARRTLRRLGARKVATCNVPVVFDPRAAASLLKHVADAVCGTALVRKASFLMDRLGQRVASTHVTLFDDALRPGGLASRPFDSEGVPSRTTTVIEQGILSSYLLDSYSARKLGMRSTANSNREVAGAPSVGPTNFYLQPGPDSPETIIGAVRNGLLVTELIGFGVNIVSGNYSQGAAGVWIENGELAFPVEEVTIAGNLADMLAGIEAVGNDLLPLGEVFAPSILIGRMTVSGK